MKNFIVKKGTVLTLSLSLILSLYSCDKALDINTSPNNASLEQGTPELVFPSAVASTAGTINGEYAVLGGIWSQFWTQSAVASQFRSIDSYNITQSDFSGRFDEVFSGALNDYDFTIKKSEETEKWRFFLMATVMKAYTYGMMVDLYDTLPYTEAFKGAGNLTPKYDDGYTIYKGIIAEIDNALSKNYNSGASAGKADIVFAGDITEWVKFANTLKLKLYLRMVYAKPQEAEAGIKAMYTAGAPFLTKSAAISIFQDLPDKSNPFYEYNYRKLNINTNLRASNTMLTFLQGKGDTRLPLYYSFSSGSIYRGLDQGDYTNPDPTLINVSIAKAKATDPADFISGAESYFLQAEALERYYGGVGAKTAYNLGVKAAFDVYSLSSASFTATGGVYEYPTAGSFEAKLESIIVQKWASLPGAHSLEAFFEKNRTGYPKTSAVYSTSTSYVPGEFVYPKTGTTNGLFVKRLIIPEGERKTNPNVPAIVPITTKVWWDKK